MLVLSRKKEETIHIGDQVTVKVIEIRGNVVRLGISAPQSDQIWRGELANEQPFRRATLGASVEIEVVTT